jgi:hypothetical protein
MRPFCCGLTVLLKQTTYLIVPPLRVRAANNVLRLTARTTQQEDSLDGRYSTWYGISVENLDRLVKSERERASKLDSKAAGIAAVLVVALTVGGTFAAALVDKISTPSIKTLAQLGLLLSASYILLGGWLGLFNGLAAKPQRGYGPDWEAGLSEDPANKGPRVEALIDFEIANILRNNNIYGALLCVGNGIVMFFAFVLLAFADGLNHFLARILHVLMTVALSYRIDTAVIARIVDTGGLTFTAAGALLLWRSVVNKTAIMARSEVSISAEDREAIDRYSRKASRGFMLILIGSVL